MDPHNRQARDDGYDADYSRDSDYSRYEDADYADYDSDGYSYEDYDGDYEAEDEYGSPKAKKRPRRLRGLRRRKKLVAALSALILLGGGGLVAWGYVSSVPTPEHLFVPETTTLYYADGKTVMARLGSERRTILDPKEMNDAIKQATVAAEDLAFWEGTRTNITRQYVRLAADINSRSTAANVRVAIMAGKLEDKFSKEDILGFYLNTIYYGRGAHGVEEAAKAYFGKTVIKSAPAETQVTRAEAIVLASVVRSPEDGTYDPSVNPTQAQERFDTVRNDLVKLGAVDRATADGLTLPTSVVKYDPAAYVAGLDKPTGLVVKHVLSELRQLKTFAGKPLGYIENGGFAVVTTLRPEAQALIEKYADETSKDSPLFGQPTNLQAAAVAVEPGTGRVLAYFGGHSGTGSDFAGWYYDDNGAPTGYGAHQPGGTFQVYALAAALKDGISMRSYWDSRSPQNFPQSGRTGRTAVRNTATAKCQPACTLVDAMVGGLDTPYFGLTETVSAARVIELARAAGIDDMWSFGPNDQRERVDLRDIGSGADVAPTKFTNEVGLGQYPVTVLDQANAMATFAAGGLRAQAHFVREVRQDGKVVYSERLPTGNDARVLSPAAIDDLTYAMSLNTSGKLAGGRAAASKTGTWRAAATTDNAHAWIVGFTPSLAAAVWIGNKAEEKPLVLKDGKKIFGSGVPATIYRSFMNDAHTALQLKKVAFAPPKNIGDVDRGNTPPPGGSP